MKTSIVLTTINIPINLESYTESFRKYGHRDVGFVVIGDRKSPTETGAYLDDLQKKTGYAIEYWDVDRQKGWLKEFPELDEILPYNSVQRRNIGYLRAVMLGAENIISIDDDNYAAEGDYLGGHDIVGKTLGLPCVSSSNGWFNTGSLLKTVPQKPLFHRGFPTSKRDGEELKYSEIHGRVVVNAGLWLEVPDADAMSHVDCPVRVTGFRDNFDGRLAVAHGTNMVFNSQNTAFHRDLLPAIFLMPMGECVGDLEVGRYDDIWMGIFVKVIADHLGDYVSVGLPWARQDRNDHDLIQDMLVEIPGMRLTNKFSNSLQTLSLQGDNYNSCYSELITFFRKEFAGEAYTKAEREYLGKMFDRMEIWLEICSKF